MRRLAGHEFGEGHVGAGERARRSRLHELEHPAVPAIDRERHGEDGGVASLAEHLSLGPLEQIGRSQICDDEPPPGLQRFPHGGQRSLVPALLLGRRAGRGAAARGEDGEGVVSLGEGDPALGHPDAFGRHASQSEQRRSLVAGSLRDRRDTSSLERRVRARRLFGVQQRLDIRAPVAAVPAWTAVAGQLAGVTPAAQGVEADAKLRRRLAEAEPSFAVRSSYAHIEGEVEVAGRSEVHQF